MNTTITALAAGVAVIALVQTVTHRGYAAQTYTTESVPGGTVPAGGTLERTQQVAGSFGLRT